MSPLRFRIWHPGTEEIEAHMDYNPKVKDRLIITYEAMNEMTLDKIVGRAFRVNEVFTQGAWMQSTGLFDKNGNEIFEGDIVRWDGQASLVEWEGSSFVHQPFAKPHGKVPISHCDESDIEVIGNIYENPGFLPPSR